MLGTAGEAGDQLVEGIAQHRTDGKQDGPDGQAAARAGNDQDTRKAAADSQPVHCSRFFLQQQAG